MFYSFGLFLFSADYDEYGLSHAIHLHGYDFYIIEQGAYPEGMAYNESLSWLQEKLAERTADDIPEYPVMKDTFALTSGGYTIVRILTDNPGKQYSIIFPFESNFV